MVLVLNPEQVLFVCVEFFLRSSVICFSSFFIVVKLLNLEIVLRQPLFLLHYQDFIFLHFFSDGNVYVV